MSLLTVICVRSMSGFQRQKRAKISWLDLQCALKHSCPKAEPGNSHSLLAPPSLYEVGST